MTSVTIRLAGIGDEAAVLRMNDAEVQWTSPMDSARLAQQAEHATYYQVACVDGEAAAFLLGMRERCGYVNDNYQWFEQRYARFFYVDRIVVDTNFAGTGLGRALYSDAFLTARSQGADYAVCEYNVAPLNEPSKYFHDSMGFVEAGQRRLAGSEKTVSMQCLELGDFI